MSRLRKLRISSSTLHSRHSSSTPGIEMALLGKPVILASRAFYENGSHTLNVLSQEALPQVLEASLLPAPAREIRREAFRLAYYYVFQFEMPFPLVSKLGVTEVEINYTSTDALAPGKDATLDHACRFLTGGADLFDSPTRAESERTTADEDAFLAEFERTPEPLRDRQMERQLKRIARFNRLGRSVQAVSNKLLVGSAEKLTTTGKSVQRWITQRLKRNP